MRTFEHVGKEVQLKNSKHRWWLSHYADDDRYVMLTRLGRWKRITVRCRIDNMTFKE